MREPTRGAMPRRLLALVPAALAAHAASAVGQSTERHALSGRDVAVYNLVGAVRVEGASGADVVVEVTPRGDDARALRVATGEIRGRQTLRVLYPERRIHYAEEGRRWGRSRTTLSVAEDGTFGDGTRGGRRVEISGEGDGLDARADLRIALPPGKRFALHLAVGDATLSNVDGEIVVDVAGASVTTTRTRGSLLLDTGSGEVQVTDAEGDVELDTGSGAVTLTGVSGGRLRLDTGSGRVRGSRLEVTDLDLDTGSGRIDLSDVRAGDVIIDSGSGSVELGLVANVRSLRLDTGSGDVTLTVPESFGAELVAETGSGGVDVDLPLTVRRRERGYLAGTIGGGGGRISIDSGSGDVRIRRGS